MKDINDNTFEKMEDSILKQIYGSIDDEVCSKILTEILNQNRTQQNRIWNGFTLHFRENLRWNK